MRVPIKKRRGFSLLELLAVVLIAMVTTLLVVNSYSVMQQRRSLRSSAESVRDVFMTARSYAVSRNAWHRVVIQIRNPAGDPDAGVPEFGFWIDEIDPDSNTDPNPATLEQPNRALVVPWQDLPDNISITDADIEGNSYTAATAPNPYFVIRFRPNGTSDDASITLLEPATATPSGPIISEVRLFSATAKPRIVAAQP